MDEAAIIEITNKVFEESFEIKKEKLQPQANIFEDLGLDSLDIVDLVVELQKNFKVIIQNDQSIREIRTLKDVYRFIVNKKKELSKE